VSSQSPKQLLYSRFVAVAKALGHSHRLEIPELLAQGERSEGGYPEWEAAGLPVLR
jgi:hypothetical protein